RARGLEADLSSLVGNELCFNWIVHHHFRHCWPMRPLITAVAAATLLMHALVGCGWHHRHVAATTPNGEAQILPVVCGGHFHSHARHQHRHAHEPAAPADHRHSEDDGCGEQTCQFVRVDSSTPPSLLDGP